MKTEQLAGFLDDRVMPGSHLFGWTLVGKGLALRSCFPASEMSLLFEKAPLHILKILRPLRRMMSFAGGRPIGRLALFATCH